MEGRDPMKPNQENEHVENEPVNQRIRAINLCRELAIEENEQVLRVIVYALEKWTNPQESELKVIEASRCIKHWHDHIFANGDEGMVVSGEHVRKLWQALA